MAGKVVDHRGEYYTVENARICTSTETALLGLFRELAPGRPAAVRSFDRAGRGPG